MTCLAEWAEQYLDFSQVRFVAKTYDEKKSAFKRFFKEVDATLSVVDLNMTMTLKFLQNQLKNRSGYGANKDRKNLLAGWNWGNKYMDPNLPLLNPFLVEKMPEERSPRYVPPEKDFWKVFNLTEGQDRIMLLTFLHLAARRSELFRLKWSDVDFENLRIRLWTRKRKNGALEPDWLPMTDELNQALAGWKEEIPIKGNKQVFICLERFSFCKDRYGEPFEKRQHFMGKLCEKAGVEKFGFHAIRHFTASSLYNLGCDLSEIQAILRHKSPSTTERYLKSIGIEKVRGSLEKFSKHHHGNIKINPGKIEIWKSEEIKKAV
ncbi:MAG: site-specific integrase [Desulfobacula sp.]|nr:site-specific integrase [Desulfobacula sp.]